MIIETGFEQGSPEWLSARMKSIGSTGISNLITTKGVRSKSRDDYLISKASKIITGREKTLYPTYDLKWGHEFEPESREIFEFTKGINLDQCAMIFSDDNRNWHISPDGFNLMKEVGWETKCPQLKEFMDTVNGAKLPTKHILQLQSSLALTGWRKWYFQSYFPGLKPFIIKVERDEALIRIIKAEVKIFLRDLNKLIEELKT